MTIEDFISRFRIEVKDASEPYLWSDADVVRFINEALNDMAKPEERGGAGYFLDRSTWAALSVAADDPVILDANAATEQPSLAPIMKITRARLVGVNTPLDVMSVAELEDGLLYDDYGTRVTGTSLSWETTTGTPRVLLTDYEDGFRLYPTPTQAYTLNLVCLRLPLTELTEPGTVGSSDWKADISQTLLLGGMEVAEDERTLLQGVKAKAYSDMHDADAYDEQMAAKHGAMFAQKLSELAYRLRSRRSPPRTVRPNMDYF